MVYETGACFLCVCVASKRACCMAEQKLSAARKFLRETADVTMRPKQRKWVRFVVFNLSTSSAET